MGRKRQISPESNCISKPSSHISPKNEDTGSETISSSKKFRKQTSHLGWRSEALSSDKYVQLSSMETPSQLDVEELKKQVVRNTKWEDLVKRTLDHPSFGYNYNFPTNEDGWISTQDCKVSKKREYPAIVALDCEMCVTMDPETSFRNSKALVRASLVDGEDLESVYCDVCVFQPELPGHVIINYKTDIHGITPEQITNAQYNCRSAQKKILKLISKDTIVVGHSVHYDLASLKISHHRVIDTAFLFRRIGDSSGRAVPALRDLCNFLLKKDMPSAHNSCEDARISMEAAIYALQNGLEYQVERFVADDTNPNQLRIHSIPEGLTEVDLQGFFRRETYVVPILIQKIVWKQSSANKNGLRIMTGCTKAVFSSEQHANLAFDTIKGIENVDKLSRMQKRLNIHSESGTLFNRIQIGKIKSC